MTKISTESPSPTALVRKTHRLYDEGGGQWFDVYEGPGIVGKPVVATVPREDQAAIVVRRALLRKGADLPSEPAQSSALVAAIAADAPIVHRASRTGWRNNNRAFVSNSYVAGDVEGITIVPPESAIGSVRDLRSRGTLEGWQALVSVAAFSSPMILALCAAFAAPLLKILRRPSFGLVLVGPSRSGKSTAQLIAGSVLGFRTEEELPSLNATHAGLLAAALAFCDHVLPVNEIGTARGPKRDIYNVLREATYALMNGQDVLRHPSWTGGSHPTAGSFQVICLMSSEIGPDDWAARNGEMRDEGETARLIGVPVLYCGRETVFDRAPKELSGDALVAWEAKQFRRLRHGLPGHCGVAFRDYIDTLVRERRKYNASASALVEHFIDVVAQPAMSSVQRDIVAKFGVLYAGGILAVRAGVLPLHPKLVGSAVRRACIAALAKLPDPAAELRADLGHLRDRLSEGGMVDLDSCTGKQRRLMQNADGFHQPKNDGQLFVVRAQVFATWFGTPLRQRRLLEWLDDEGFLDHGRDRAQRRSNEWAQKQVTWPNQTRVRSIAFYLPGGLSDLRIAS